MNRQAQRNIDEIDAILECVMRPKPTPAASALYRVCDPQRRDLCSECENPRLFGEQTCGNTECIESLLAAMFADSDGDAERESEV